MPSALLAAALLAASLAASPPARAGGFGDLGDYGWAAPGIVALQGEGAIHGVGAGTFDPGGLLTRAQAAAILGRLLGWPAGPSSAPLPFTDAGTIPAYARPYVALAAARGILQGLPDGAFAPQGNLTWPQLATMAGRALGDAPVPTDRVAALLGQLPQGPSTPQWAQQGVVQAVAAGDFAGVLADMYQPEQPVTRAELAAFLAEAQPDGSGGGTVLSGELTDLSGGEATVQTAAGSQRVAVSPGAAVYDGSAPGSLSDLQAGENVVLAGANGVATAVDITAGGAIAHPVGLTAGVSGTLAFTTGTEIGVALPGMPTVYVPLAANATVGLPGGRAGGLGDLADGQPVNLTLNGAGQAVAIDAGTGAPATSMSGSVVSLAGTSLVLDIAGTDETFSLPARLTGTAGLGQGAHVTLTLALPAGQVTGLTVDAPAPATSVTGTITALSGDQLALDASGTSHSYSLSAATTVNGLSGNLAALAVGQTVTLLVSGGQASSVEIAASAATVSGVIASVVGDTLEVNAGGTDRTYTLTSATTVDGQANDLAALAAGQSVTLLVSGGQVDSVETVAGSATVSGVVASVIGDTLQVDVAGTDQTYTLISATTVDGQANDLAALAAGQSVTLLVSGGQVDSVEIAAGSATVSGVVVSVTGDTLQLDVAGTDQTYRLTSATTVDGLANDLSALAAGQSVTLTVTGGQVTAVLISAGASTVSGVVASVAGNTLVVDVAGTGESYTLSAATTVNGVADNLGALAAGDAVTLTLAGNLVTAAEVGAPASGTSASAASTTGIVESLAGNNLILDVAGTAQVFTVTPSTTVNGAYGDLSLLVPGTTVTLTLSSGAVTAVQVVPTSGTAVTGRVLALAGNTLALDVSGGGQAYTITPTTTVDGRLNNLGAVFIGETVTATVNGTAVAAITTSAAGSVTGSVVSVAGSSLVVDVAGTYDTYTLTATTTVDGALNNTGALAAGQTVTVYGAGGSATAVQITAATGGAGATGLLTSVAGGAVVVDVAGVSQAYTLTGATTVDGALNNTGALAAGQTISLTAVSGQVTAIQILSVSGSYTVSGIVASVAGFVVVVDAGGTDETFTLTPATAVNGVTNNTAAIAAGDTVTVTMAAGQVTAVQVG